MPDHSKETNINQLKRECVLKILELHKRANSGHIAASLSCLEILIYLKFRAMAKDDILILSKGHAASALYTVLVKHKDLPEADLDTYYTDGTYFGAHPACNNKINGIRFGTGSLGHGLSLAAGLALSTKYTGKSFNVYCVISDGDCDEGSTWEAALFAAQHRLSNLFVIIDNNGLQGFGTTKNVLNLEPLEMKWKAFNFEVAEAANGNSFSELDKSLNYLFCSDSDKPRCLIAKTIKGNGISFMMNKMEWHYLPLTDALYEIAIKEAGEIDA